MPADNWTYCPSCKTLKEQKDKAFQDEADKAYGKVSIHEYRQLLAFAESGGYELNQTLREDYELGIRDGRFFVDYRAWCSKCGFSYEHKHNESVIPKH